METVEINSTSRHSASCSDILLREGSGQVRLVFRPEMVDNPANPAASMKGRFLYQRKGKHDEWVDFDYLPLTSVKKGEGYQLALHSAELHQLLRELGALYRVHRRDGLPKGKLELLKVEQSLAEMLALTEQDLLAFFSAHSQDAVRTLRVVLQWFAKQAIAQDLISQGEELPALNALVGLANLRSVLKTWSANLANPNEEFWQQLFSRHSFVLSQLFAYPVVLIKGKAYVGGKDLTNTGGNIVDFLLRTESTGATALIEIKTPATPLLGREYRQGVFSASEHLSGGIAQVLEYRESLQTEFHILSKADSKMTMAEPSCILIMGDADVELDTNAKKLSFERFRKRLLGVQVFTYDELFRRIEGLVNLLENA